MEPLRCCLCVLLGGTDCAHSLLYCADHCQQQLLLQARYAQQPSATDKAHCTELTSVCGVFSGDQG